MAWYNEDDDYDDGSEDSGKSHDWDMEPGDPGWLGPMPDDEDEDPITGEEPYDPDNEVL